MQNEDTCFQAYKGGVIRNMISLSVIFVIVFLGYLFWFYLWKRPLFRRSRIYARDIVSDEAFINPEVVSLSSWKLLSLYIVMVGGMAAVVIFRDIQHTGTFDFARFRIDFVLGLLVSPMVFHLMVSQAPSRRQWFFLYCYAFQNGFFWEAIFSQFFGG